MKHSIIQLCAIYCILFSTIAQAQIGNPAPDFTVTDTHGETQRLYDYLDSGKVVVLDFFFTTCGPCQFYSPQVNLAYEKYGCNMADVIFISIDYDDSDAEVLAYDQTYNIQYPSISGTEGGGNAVVNQYNIIGFPTFYVIDSSKTIIEIIDPPTLQVFDFRFQQHGIQPASCISAAHQPARTGQLQISPNPVAPAGKIRFSQAEFTAGKAQYEILNLGGLTVLSGVLELGGTSEIEINTDTLPSGMHLLKIWRLDGSYSCAGVFVVL